MDNLLGTLNSAVPTPPTASSSSSVAKGQDNSPSAEDSMHNPNVQKEQMDLEQPDTLNKPNHIPRNANLSGSNWVTVTKKKGFPVVLPLEALGEASLDDKKAAAYWFLLSFNQEFTSFQAKKINGIDLIGASFYTEEEIERASCRE